MEVSARRSRFDSFLRDHLSYEVAMLRSTYREILSEQERLKRVHECGSLTLDVLADAFAAHAGNLLDFFETPRPPHGLTPLVFTRPSYRVDENLRDRLPMDKLYGQVASLQSGDRALVLMILESEIARFKGALKDEWKGCLQ